jgi:hypothetical protein
MATTEKPKKPAVQIEAEAIATTTIKWKNFEFTIESDSENLDVDVVEAMEEGKVVAAVRAILGPKQWFEFKKTKPRMSDIGEISDIIAEVYGFANQGE